MPYVVRAIGVPASHVCIATSLCPCVARWDVLVAVLSLEHDGLGACFLHHLIDLTVEVPVIVRDGDVGFGGFSVLDADYECLGFTICLFLCLHSVQLRLLDFA